ncbi:MAG TPA: phosphate ABC transporter substrate-binding/OmpA family protein [Gemmataceae bacterium]|nr:phosphate ABC transporter substrate-binding/OmpA family protein [Gemmataceae bacterium]
MAAGQPKPAFYIVAGVVVVALIGFALYKGVLTPHAPTNKDGTGGPPLELGEKAESTDKPKLSATEWKEIHGNKLPEVKGASKYKPMTDNTVRFAINVWAGWAPIFLANDGMKPGKVWKGGDGTDFKVELVMDDNPIHMFDAYASGDYHVGWATLDMVPLFLQRFVDKEGKPKDTRIMPRVYQQIDWSNGGDGIVVRENLKTVADLRGKKIALAENSPSHYFALTMLVFGGVQPSEVEFSYYPDAFQAAAAFNARKELSACVSWSPDIYNLAKVKGNRMLVTTSQANKLIADVWFARADFAKDHPEIMEGLVRGIFDAMQELKGDAGKKHAAELMAKGYSIELTDAMDMLNDAHNTNWAENHDFFLDPGNSTNFERIWNQSYLVYRRVGNIDHQPVPFNQVMDFSVIDKLGQEDKYKSQKNEYHVQFTPQTVKETKGAEKPILTNTIYVKFAPNSWDLYKKVSHEVNGKTVEDLYDPTVDAALEQIAKLSGQFAAARIVIEGHSDTSMQGQVPATLVKELSLNRANAVKEGLLQKYKDLDPNRFAVEGVGWDRPADEKDQSKNRRVEVTVYTAEKQ